MRPALDTEYFMEIAAGLANDGKMSAKGKPKLLQSAVLMNRFSNVFRLTKPPYAVQKVMFGILGIAAWVMGYRGWNKSYVDY